MAKNDGKNQKTGLMGKIMGKIRLETGLTRKMTRSIRKDFNREKRLERQEIVYGKMNGKNQKKFQKFT